MQVNSDITIIGNGVLGLSLALRLAVEAPKLNISLIGPYRRPGSATAAAGAMLGCYGEVTSATHHSPQGKQTLNDAVEAYAVWPEWLEMINEHLNPLNKLQIKPGTFVLLNTESARHENENYESIISALRQYKQPFEDTDPNKIPGMDPVERCRPLKAIFMPNEGYINPVQLLHGLGKACDKHGVRIFNDNVVDFTTENNKISMVWTKKGHIFHTNQVVLAAGGYTQKLLEKISDVTKRIPKILSGVGCGLILRNSHHHNVPIKHVIRSPNRAGACGVHILPYSDLDDSLFYMGASNAVGLVPKEEAKVRDLHYLTKRAIEQFNQKMHQFDVVKQCIGNRPMAIDGFPLIGKTSIEGLSLLTGTYRTGIHFSPFYSKLLAEEILYNKPATSYFQPERAPIEIFSKKQAISEFVRQYTGVGAEHSINLPYIGWHEMLQEIIQQRAEAIYNELQTNIAIHPDILIMLEMNRQLIPVFKDYYKNKVPSKERV